MRLGIIACGVLEWHIQSLLREAGDRQLLEFYLPAGLHANPTKLRQLLQEQIDAWSQTEALDGIILGYGVCGRGAIGLFSRQIPVLIPRTQDCIGIFLGSHARYQEQFFRRPGTRYMTQGLFEKTTVKTGDASYMSPRDKSLYGIQFTELEQRYGADNARYICDFRESWTRNYQRAAYIRFPGEASTPPGRVATQGTAETLGWEFEELAGDPSLLTALLSGRWDDPRILVVPPFSRTVPSPGNEVISFTTGFDCQIDALLQKYHTKTLNPSPTRAGIGLGIDTGGTFTDAVLYDFSTGAVLATAKAPTTHHDLAHGIRGALAALPVSLVQQVTRVGLSTTLATNAFVERKGRPVALFVMSPIPVPLEALPFQYVRRLAGAMTIEGEETEAIVPAEVLLAAQEARAQGCQAIAVSAFGSVFNPCHELQVAELVFAATALPVVCGHELTSQLNFLERATTAAMNAKLIPLIESLLDAVRMTLQDYGLHHTPVFVVRGDGSQMLDRVARQTPVETVLSGPAASVIGALRLFKLDHAVVVDMGGTTLDLAVVRDGSPLLRDEGATVAGFQTSVRAMAVHTIGLGGDSEIDLSAWPAVRIGPRRITPISRMGESYPDAGQRLRRLQGQLLSTDRNALEWISLAPGIQPESTFEELLRDGPVCLQELARQLLRPTPAHLGWSELEGRGRLVRFGLTLTDILHYTGEFTAYDRDAALFLVDLWANLLEVDPKDVVEAARAEFRRMVCEQVLGVILPDNCPWNEDQRMTRWLTRHLVDPDASSPAASFQVRVGLPIIAVGAPVSALFPSLSAILHQDVLISEHAGVANAIGAIAGDVRLQETAEIRVADDGGLLCRWRGGHQRATSLDNALRACEEALRERIREKALANDIPYAAPDFKAQVQQAETRDGVLLLGLALLATLRG